MKRKTGWILAAAAAVVVLAAAFFWDDLTAHPPASTTAATTTATMTTVATTGTTADTSAALTCTLEITCATVLDHMDDLTDGKDVLIPEDGYLLPRTEVTFTDGETVFDILQRETRSRKLHMEFTHVPVYDSVYIEGIGNLYEFDCGELSGWMYAVNGVYNSYGAGKYTLQPGDEVVWAYTCDLGADLGAGYTE